MKWFRTSKLNKKEASEMWVRSDNQVNEEFPLEVVFGKRTDLLKLKRNVVSKIEENFKFYHQSRTSFFSEKSNLQPVDSCEACGAPSDDAEFLVSILAADYYQCRRCTHVYLKMIPTLPAIEAFYRTNTQYSQTYTDKDAAEFRLNSVDVPLAEFMLARFKTIYGGRPGAVLDIGAGGGHFVEACRRMGMKADGFEFSDSSVNFAKDVWNFKMDQRDFVQVYKEYSGYDVVTFWGLLEHVPNPYEFLNAARWAVKDSEQPMIICRVPKWDSVSTTVQSFSPDSIVRHLDPLGHIMIYTESSLCELFRRIDYKPVSIWYYGMDSYEMMMQIGHLTNNYDHLKVGSTLQQEVQQQLDNNYLSDLMVMAFIPNK